MPQNPPLPIGLIILAAGASTRMGVPKQLLRLGQSSLLSRAIETALASICDPIVVVLGAYAEQIRPEVVPFPVKITESNWQVGMSASIHAGLQKLEATCPPVEAAIVMLCDQPFVSVALINQLAQTYRLEGSAIVASIYSGKPGVPALFSRSLFPELMQLQGADGARSLFLKYANQVTSIAFSEGAIDIDTPSEYLQIQREY
jgi:molybdenum cofactor cytidylyltransferase